MTQLFVAARRGFALLAVCTPIETTAGPIYDVTNLTPENARFACASDVNAAGHVVGSVDLNGDGDSRGFFWADGQRIGLGTGYASALNDSDTIVGTSGDAVRGTRAYIVRDGVRSGLDVRGGVRSESANGVSEAGAVCGDETGPNGQQAVGVRTNGRAFYLDLGDPIFSYCSDISSDGRMTGLVTYADGITRGFIGRPRHWTLMPMPHGASSVDPMAVNALGDASGYFTGTVTHAFVYHGGHLSTLPSLLPGKGAIAWGMNDVGQIVGTADANDNTASHAVLFDTDGTITDLNTRLDPESGRGWLIDSAMAINNTGVIVGCGLLQDAKSTWQHAVMLTPESAP